MKVVLLFACLTLANWGFGSPPDAPLKFKHRPAGEEKAPVVILLHGYGSNEADLFSIQMSTGYHVFSLRGPYVLQNGGYSWFGLQSLGNKQFTFDYNQAKESREKILAFISWTCKEYKADSFRVVVIGFSQGAMMSFDLALQARSKISGVAALSGGIVPGSKTAVSAHVRRLPVFIAHGDADEVVEYKYSTDARDFLVRQGARVTFKSYHHGHNISGVEINDLLVWIKTTIPKK